MCVPLVNHEIAYLRETILKRSDFTPDGCDVCGSTEFTVENELEGGSGPNVKLYAEVICEICFRSKLVELPFRPAS